MEKFNQLLHGIYYLRDFIPLNLFMLDNRIVNRVLEKLVRELKNFVTSYFTTLNQVENRRMCDEFEEMSINSGERPSETPEVVALQNYLVVCREDKLFRLKSEKIQNFLNEIFDKFILRRNSTGSGTRLVSADLCIAYT